MKLAINCIWKNVEYSTLENLISVFGTCDKGRKHCSDVMCPDYEEKNGL